MPKQKIWSGDDGQTDYLGKGRVEKSSQRMEVLGSLDEASAALGLAKSACREPSIVVIIENVQRTLYRLMTKAASSMENIGKFPGVTGEDVSWLENEIHDLESNVTIPQDFILPGATKFSAALDLARTIVRRAERRLVESSRIGEYQNPEGLKYLNRLSTLIFYLEIKEMHNLPKQRPFLAKEI
jgi:cob(I)alamin adenosyltransferase